MRSRYMVVVEASGYCNFRAGPMVRPLGAVGSLAQEAASTAGSKLAALVDSVAEDR